MVWMSPKDAMPWVGMYVGVASFICTLAMAVDSVQAIWLWKFWFPNRFFTLNASTLTLIAIAMKLPVDLSTTESCTGFIEATKTIGILFLTTMLANFLPSLGLMDDRELLMNIVALGILLITVAVNIGIQVYTYALWVYVDPIPILIFVLVWPFSVALTVSASRKKLEHRYKESQRLISSYQQKRFSSKELRNYVKKYWMMTETRNPQFVIACSPVSSAFGVICLYVSLISGLQFVRLLLNGSYYCETSDYKWSLRIIYFVQSLGTLVGSIAPIFRCLSSVGHYSLSKEWSKNHLNVFRVEKHWIQKLQQWKRRDDHSFIPGRHCKIVFHIVKNTFLSLCILLHILVLVLCKTISLVPRVFLILFSYCWHLFKSCIKWFLKIANTPYREGSSEVDEYVRYVVQIEEDAKLSERILRNTLRYITQLLNASEEKEPHNLMVLLEKSIGFNGVLEFENDQVQPLYEDEIQNSWSLVVVTLTSIAIALPNVRPDNMESLLSSMREGIQIVRSIEECLNGDSDTLEIRKAAKRVWAEVDVYRSWLQIDLQKMARKGKTTKEIIKWLGDEAEKIAREFKSSKKPSIDQSPYKFILASSMYRISRSMLVQWDEQKSWSNGENLFDKISTIIADILSACFTNLPRVIRLKCHHHAIEKRGENIRNAAKLLGKSKKILKMLKARKLPNMDLDSMAYIDNWHALPTSEILDGTQILASSTRIEPGSSSSSSCNKSLIVSIV